MFRRNKKSDRNKSSSPRTTELDPADVRKVIYTLDAYRAHLFYDVTWIDAKVEQRTLGRNFAAKWKDLRRMMIKMAHVPAQLPGVPRLVRLQGHFEALWQIAGPLVFILFFATLLAPKLPLIGSIAPGIMVAGLGALLIGLLARFFIGRDIGLRIEEHFARNPELHQTQSLQLRESIQLLIEELRGFVRETPNQSEKQVIGVSLLDYNHIKVTKKPRPWRRYYLAIVEK